MAKDLTSSPLDRQNILNNRYALEKLEGIWGWAVFFIRGSGCLLSSNWWKFLAALATRCMPRCSKPLPV